MNADFDKLFTQIQTPDMPLELLQKVIDGVRVKQRRSALIRCTVFLAGFIASMGGLISAFLAARGAITESGFSDYFSLLFSDTGSVLSTWGNYAMALLESFPIVNAIFFLAAFFLFLEFLKYLIQNIRFLFSIPHLTHNF